jgi:hypothetical protein
VPAPGSEGSRDRALRWLTLSWWVIWPLFTMVVLVFVRERACWDRYDLVPSVSRRPALAWMLATFYVSAHCWLAGAYVATARTTGELLPPLKRVKQMWGGAWPQLPLVAIPFAIEYAPAALWTSAAHWLHRCS